VNLDWRRLRAVVLESDDWGLCGWVPDEQAYRVLADTPAFRTPAGRRYGRTTLESARDVRLLTESLLEFRGGDGFPPVLQANQIVAAPDYARLRAPLFEVETLPLVALPAVPSRWRREGMWDAVREATQSGVWWTELHGLHHLPEAAWLAALRRSSPDARRAHEHQSPICQAVEASGEYDPSEPAALRKRNLDLAIEMFETLTGRAPRSLCPPDYRWDDSLEAQAAARQVTVLQGKSEQANVRFLRLRRLLHQRQWPRVRGARFYMPPRIAFEPAHPGSATPYVERTRRLVRAAWGRSQPAVISTHRANYAHLDEEWSKSGRAAMRDLLATLVEDGAVFLVDVEVHDLQERGWSLRPIGERGGLLRYFGVPRETLRFPAPQGVSRVAIRESRSEDASITIEGGEVVAKLHLGEYLLEWNPS